MSAKYVNSPASEIYDKSRLIFGLDKAIESIREKGEVILVEGQMDCITAHSKGFTNTVAVSGTSFTKKMARLLFRYTDRILIAYDNDAAGKKAVVRTHEVIQEIQQELERLSQSKISQCRAYATLLRLRRMSFVLGMPTDKMDESLDHYEAVDEMLLEEEKRWREQLTK